MHILIFNVPNSIIDIYLFIFIYYIYLFLAQYLDYFEFQGTYVFQVKLC